MVTAGPPKLSYWHVWSDDHGVTHQAECELTAFAMKSVGGKAQPQWNDDVLRGETNIVMSVLPVGWIGDWHENPKPQWIVVVSGRWFVETMDGTRVEMGPGDLAFGGDQNAKQDPEGRIGHRSARLAISPAY